MGLLFVLASLGLPGLDNFIAEILILTGSFMASKILTVIAALGFIAATLYSQRIMQKVFYTITGTLSFRGLANTSSLPASATILVVIAGVGKGNWLLAFTLVISSIIGLYYYLRLIFSMMRTDGKNYPTDSHTSHSSLTRLLILSLLGGSCPLAGRLSSLVGQRD